MFIRPSHRTVPLNWIAAAALVALATACGSSSSVTSSSPTATPPPTTSSAPSSSPSATPSSSPSTTPSSSPSTTPSATSSASPSPTTTPTPTHSTSRPPAASPTTSTAAPVDVSAAARAALGLYARHLVNTADPSKGYVWSAKPYASLPVTSRVRARLEWLNAHDWFADMNCGESYIDGNQVGLTRAPQVVSARAHDDGTVTVVVRGFLNDTHRDLTVVMSQVGGTWLARDLRRGSGADASIFAA